MALLGLISLLQICFIPGYLSLYRAKDISRPDKFLLAVPLSATINFFLVYVLVWLHAYTQNVMLAVFALEVIAFLFLARIKSKQQTSRPPQQMLALNFDFTNIVFAIVLLLHVCQALNQIGTVFTQGDVISSWNPWAHAWFNGGIPHDIGWYPQLLPILYSITYQFMAESQVELFAKVAVSLYPVITFAMLIRMAFLFPSERKNILWSGIIFFLLVRRLWGGESTVNGYADFPLAFFCISIIYVFALKEIEQSRQAILQSNTLAFVMVGITIGAGLMKQSGVFLGMLAPFFWLAYFRNGKELSAHIKHSALLGIMIALPLSTWYLYQLWRIATGMELSYLQYLTSVVPLPWYQSIAYGFNGITYKLSWLWIAVFLMALAHRKVRYLALYAVAPFFLLWAAFVPYDYRNLAAVFPLLAICLVYGWAELTGVINKILPTYFNRQLIWRGTAITLAIISAVALANPKFNDELRQLSDNAKSQIGDPGINSRMMAYFEFNPAPALVASAYSEISNIPALSKRYAHFKCGADDGKQSYPFSVILSELDNPAIRYILVEPWCDVRVLKYFASQPDKYRVVFSHNGSIFYSITSD